MPGYSVEESADIDPNILIKHICCICKMLVRDAVQTISCGHIYCRQCMFEALEGGSEACAECKHIFPGEPTENTMDRKCYFTDGRINTAVGGMPALCVNRTNGCDWKGTISEADNHRSVCSLY